MLVVLGLTLLFASYCLTYRDHQVKMAGILIGLFSLLTFWMLILVQVYVHAL